MQDQDYNIRQGSSFAYILGTADLHAIKGLDFLT